MKKVILIATYSIIAVIIVYCILCITVQPKETYFELECEESVIDVLKGQVIEFDVILKNNSIITYRLQHSSNLINYGTRKIDEPPIIITTSDSRVGYLLLKESKTQSIEHTFDESGEYVIEIISSFTCKGKQFNYHTSVQVNVSD